MAASQKAAWVSFAQPLLRLSACAPWAALAAAVSALVALSAIAGCVLDVPRLRSVLPGAVEMKMNTGICLLLCSAALLVAAKSPRRLARRVVQILGVCAIAIGAATSCEYAFAWNLGIDELLVADTATAYNVYRGRMSPYTAAAFVLLGVAICVLAARRLRPVKWACASAVIAIGAVSAVGYLWNAQELVTDRLVPPVAINTAIVLMLLGFSTLHAGRRAWEMRSGVAHVALFSMERKIVASLLGALVVLFLGGGYTYRATVQFEDAMSAFSERQEVRSALARIVDLCGAAAMMHDNYVLGGGETRRSLYADRVRDIGEPLAAVNRLLRNDPDKSAQLALLDRDLADWFARMDADVARRTRAGSAPAELSSGQRDPAFARVETAIAQLDAAEAQIQAEQRRQAAHLREFTLASLLVTLAVATALCVLLFRAIRRTVQMRDDVRRMDALARDVFGTLATTLDRGRALDGSVQQVARLRTNGGCAFYALTSDDHLVLQASAGRTAALPLRLAMGQGRIGQAALTRLASQTPDDARSPNGGAPRGMASLFACPVVYLGRTSGVLVMVGTRGLRTHEQSFVERIADALGAALGNLQTYTDLQALSAQLGEKNEALKQQAAELDQANRLKSEFLATMSHELRTPLNAIIGFAEVLKDDLVGELSEQQREYVGDILDSGEHLLQLINDILDLSKVEAGKMDLDLDAVDLKPLFGNSLAMVKEKALAQRIELVADVDASLDSAWLDARKVKQIVYNLLSNAVKFTPSGGTVVLRVAPVEQDGWWLAVSVTDTGIGISVADQARLFQPFVQIDGSLAKQFEGTGLGLAMVKRLTELQGGSVSLDSAPGKGSTFTVLLPLRAPPVASVAKQALPEQPIALMIGPDARVATHVRVDLERAGLRVVHVQGSNAGLALAAHAIPQVITVDARIDASATAALLRSLASDTRLAAVPVILLRRPGAGDQETSDAALGAAAVDPQELRAALTALSIVTDPGRSITALVVDDEPRVAEMLDAFLQTAGCRVVRVTSGAQALVEAPVVRPDVIVLDLVMPEVSGFDVIEVLKAAPETRDIPIVVVTAMALSARDRQALAGRVEKVLSKTQFKRVEFVREVMDAVERI